MPSSSARRTGPSRHPPHQATASACSHRPETMRILHILDHSIPAHSGYTFRTLGILREQRRLGWETFHLTSPKHPDPKAAEEHVDGWTFYRTEPASGWMSRLPVL